MENFQSKYLDLLRQKLAAMHKMMEATKAANFTGKEADTEKDAQTFVALYEKRANILTRIEQLDDAMALLESDAMEDENFNTAVTEIKTEIRELAGEFITLDKENMSVYQKLSSRLKEDIKKARQSRNINNRYVEDFDAAQGHYFDARN
jgi:ABC-type Zn uptake system ZnuABC Zn-binding protein ZnuA